MNKKCVFHFLLRSSQKFSCPPSSLAMNKKCVFHFLLRSSQKISRPPSSLAMNKKCISIFFFSPHKNFLVFHRRWRSTKNEKPFSSSLLTKIFSSSIVVGDGQKMRFHFLLHSSQKFSCPPSSLAMNKKCISIFFFSHRKNFLVLLRHW